METPCRSGSAEVMVPALREVDLADSPILHSFRRALEVRSRPLLNADLHYSPVPPGGLHHEPPFANGGGNRFLYVHVFAGFAGVNRDQGMPVIRSRDHNDVDVLAIENAAVIGIGVSALSGGLASLLRGRLEYVADGANFDVGLAMEIGEIHAAHAAASDDGDADAI